MNPSLISRPDGLLYGWTGDARSRVHLVPARPHDMTALCGVWLRHGYARGEVDRVDWANRACPRCERLART
jgi:hypothetical protein